MAILRKLGNPLALVVQGFVAGAFLFLSSHPETGETIAAELNELASSATGEPLL